MPSYSVSVDEARFGVGYELCWSAAGRLTRYRSSRIWTRAGSVSDMCVAELARSDSGNLRDKTDWSSRMLPSRSEPGSIPIIYAEYRLWKPIVWTDSASGDCNDERDESNWSSRKSISRMKHELGLLFLDRSATSGYNGRRTTFSDLFRCRLTEWSTIVLMLHRRVWHRAVTITKIEYNRLAYSMWWSNTMGCKLVFLLLSSLFLQTANRKQNVMLCSKRWNGGRQREGKHPTLWCQLLRTRPSMRKITKQFVVKRNLRIGEAKQNTQREREREAQRICLFIKWQQLQSQ